MYEKEMSDINFQTYGSLTFSAPPVQTCSLVQHDASYSTGPHCGAKYWKCGVGEVELFGQEPADCGPCKLTCRDHKEILDADILI